MMIPLLLTAVLCQSPVPLSPVESAMVAAVNQERALHGMHPLRVDRRLMDSARQHALWMAAMKVNMHSRHPANVAENIGWGYSDVASVMDAWMASPPHRANVLERLAFVVGVGQYGDKWVQQFGYGGPF